MTARRDPVRSYEPIDRADLERLGRVADADLARFVARNPSLDQWRGRVRVIALAQGAAEHYLRGERGVRDLDVIVCFAGDPSRQLRRQVVSWDWGPSKFGRCPYDPPEYMGRAVDVKFWLMPDEGDAVRSLRVWLAGRLRKHPDRHRKSDVAHEPVILIRPWLGDVAWDPGPAPPPGTKTGAHRRPAGRSPD